MNSSINKTNPLAFTAALVMCSALAAPAWGQTTNAPIRDSLHQSAAGGTNSGAQGSDRILRRNVSENRGLVRLVLAERGGAIAPTAFAMTNAGPIGFARALEWRLPAKTSATQSHVGFSLRFEEFSQIG